MNNIGELNRRVEIWGKTATDEVNELGQAIYTPEKFAVVWASISPRTGSLLSGRSADTILSKTTHKITIRYPAFKELSIKNWLVCNGHRFNIDYVLPDFKQEFTEIYVNEDM